MAVPALRITAQDNRKLTRVTRVIEQSERRMLAEGPVVVAVLTEQLKEKVREKFDQHILHPDKATGYSDSTLRSESHGLTGIIEAEGGYPFKEFGTEPHDLPKVAGRVYHWSEGGQDFFSRGHHVRGVTAVDFVGEAIASMEFEDIATAMFGSALLSAITE